MPTAAPTGGRRGRHGQLALLLGAAACCCLPAPTANAQLLRRAPSDWQPPSSSPFMQGADQAATEGGDKQILRARDPNWRPPPFSPFADADEGDKQIFRRPRGDWQPPSSSPFADAEQEGAGDKQIFRRPRGDWQPPSSSPFADAEEAVVDINGNRPRVRRYLPIAANGPEARPFDLPAEPRRGYIEMDLLLSPGAHYSGGNFVAPEGDFVYYTQDGDGVLRAGHVTGKGADTTVQEKEFVHSGGSSDADGMLDAQMGAAGFKLRSLGPNPAITVSPDGVNVYALPRNDATAGGAAVAGDILALRRNPDTAGVHMLQDLALERDASALPCDEGLAMSLSADGAWLTAACRASGRVFLQSFARNATGTERGTKRGQLTHVQDISLPDSVAAAGPLLVIRAPDARGLYVVAGEAGGEGKQAVLSYGRNPKTGELRLLQTLGGLYAPNFAIDFGAFDPSGRFLFLGHASQPSFHSWAAAGAFVFSRQPGNDLALYWDPRKP